MSAANKFDSITHALVRYSDDKLKSHVIHVRDIYKFDCKAFDDTKPYVMKWFCAQNLQQPHVEYDSYGWDMHYYMGEVFSVGSKADMMNLKKTTIRWKKIIGVLTQDEERRQYNKHLVKTYSRKTSSVDKESKKEKGTNASSTSSAAKKMPTKLAATDASKKISIATILSEKKKKQSALLPTLTMQDKDTESQDLIRKETQLELEALRTEIRFIKNENEILSQSLKITQASLDSHVDQLATLQLLVKYQEDKLSKVSAPNDVCKKCRMVISQSADGSSVDEGGKTSIEFVNSSDANFYEDDQSSNGGKLVIDEESRDSNINLPQLIDGKKQVGATVIKTEPAEPKNPDRAVVQSTTPGVTRAVSKKRSAKAVKEASEKRPYNLPGYPPTYEVNGANIHLVNGLFILKKNWDLLKDESPSQFANKLFQAFYSSEEMKNLSWSGLVSPRNVKSGNALETVGVSDVKKKALLFLMEDKLERDNVFNDKEMMRKHARGYVISAVSQKSSNKRRKIQVKDIVVKKEKDEDSEVAISAVDGSDSDTE